MSDTPENQNRSRAASVASLASSSHPRRSHEPSPVRGSGTRNATPDSAKRDAGGTENPAVPFSQQSDERSPATVSPLEEMSPTVAPSSTGPPHPRGERRSSAESDDDIDMRAPSSRDMRVYFNAARKMFQEGLDVIKIGSNAKPYKRKVYINAKPEYFEISSAKLYDIGYHFLDIISVTVGDSSEAFQAFRANPGGSTERIPPACCCSVRCRDKEHALVFRQEAMRNDFVFVLRVCRRVTMERYQKHVPLTDLSEHAPLGYRQQSSSRQAGSRSLTMRLKDNLFSSYGPKNRASPASIDSQNEVV